ncbi:MAG TPA: TIGR02611 family protein [Pilimelia sp.]|nr:TIGR02611 family protein [Pilimelia sp.]
MPDITSDADLVADAPTAAEPIIGRTTRWRGRARATITTIRANPTGRIALKVGVAIVGALVVLVGIALIPLPGPGWALVILGLAIWAIEFAWARHLLSFTRTHVQRWTRWASSRSWPVRILLGLAGLLFVSAVVVLSLRYSFGVDLIGMVWKYVTTH